MTPDSDSPLPVDLPGLVTVRPTLVPVAARLKVGRLAYGPAQTPGIPEDKPRYGDMGQIFISDRNIISVNARSMS